MLEISFNWRKKCIKKISAIISDDTNDRLINDCIHKEFNKTYGCLPFFHIEYYIDVRSDLFKYKLCDYQDTRFNNNDKVETELSEKYIYCEKFVKADCKIISFKTEKLTKFTNHSTIVNIIPKHNHRMDFIESLKMTSSTIWEVLSGCGSAGLWSHFHRFWFWLDQFYIIWKV